MFSLADGGVPPSTNRFHLIWREAGPPLLEAHPCQQLFWTIVEWMTSGIKNRGSVLWSTLSFSIPRNEMKRALQFVWRVGGHLSVDHTRPYTDETRFRIFPRVGCN